MKYINFHGKTTLKYECGNKLFPFLCKENNGILIQKFDNFLNAAKTRLCEACAP